MKIEIERHDDSYRHPDYITINGSKISEDNALYRVLDSLVGRASKVVIHCESFDDQGNKIEEQS